MSESSQQPRRSGGPGPSLLVAVALCALACQERRPAAEQRERVAAGSGEVVVAAVWPWKGFPDMRYGEGLDLALEEVNSGGGVSGRPLRLKRYDDRGSVDEGVLMAQLIASDPQVMAVIGHLQSFVTAPAAAIYDLAGLVMIAPTATDPALTSHGYRRVFRATYTDRDTGRQLADFARRRYHRVAICYVRNTYGRGLANAFEGRANEIGLVIADRQSYDPGEQISARTFAPLVQEWKTLELDAIFLAGEVPSAGLFVAQARLEGLALPILGGDAMSAPALMAVAGAAAEGVVVTSFFHPDEPRPEVQQFRKTFEKRFGHAPDPASAIGYDVVHLLARAMRRARSVAPEQVAKALREMPPYTGVTGNFEFDAQGAAVGKRPVMMVVRSGRFVFGGEAPSRPE
jgi:branched-chain amino acid transport system substrate-binding protein